MATLQDATKKTFVIDGVGTFLIRRPSMFDNTQIARRRVALIGPDVSQDDVEWSIAHTIAFIDVCAEEKPANFNWDNIGYDQESWNKFYTEYGEWFKSFLSRTQRD